MFSLRDLIVRSQTQPSQLAGDVAQHYNVQSKPAYAPVEDYLKGNSDDEQEHVEAAANKQQASSRIMGAMPVDRSSRLGAYTQSPELKYSLRNITTASSTSFMPALPTYLRFPQHEAPVQATQRDIVHEIWLRSYHANDYECAAQALFTYAQISSVEFADFVRFADMLLSSSQSTLLIKYLSQIVVKLIPARMSTEQHSDLVHVLIQLLCSTGDLGAVSDLPRATVKWISIAYGTNPSLLVASCMIQCLQAMALANDICQEAGLAPMLSADTLLQQPMDFLWTVKLLHKVEVGHTVNSMSSGRQQDCRRLLRDLSSAFTTVAGLADTFQWPDFQRILMAFMIGYGQYTQVHAHVESLLRWTECVGDGFLAGQTLEVVCDLVLQLSPADALRAVSGNLLYLQSMILSKDIDNGEQAVFKAWVLFELQAIGQHAFVEKLADLVECCSTRNLVDQPVSAWFGPSEWVLWRLLADQLGNVTVLGDNQPLDPDCGILGFIPEMSVLAGKYQMSGGSRAQSSSLPEIKLEKAHREESYPIPPPPPSVPNIVQSFRDHRRWWMESILSISLLGDFAVSLLPFQVDELIRSLDNISDTMPSLVACAAASSTLTMAVSRQRMKDQQRRLVVLFDEGDEDELENEMPAVDFSRIFSSTTEFQKLQSAEDEALLCTLLQKEGHPLHDVYNRCTDRHPSAFATQSLHTPSALCGLLPGGMAAKLEDELLLFAGVSVLEVLACQALVVAHLSSADHVYVLRVVQILIQHASATPYGHSSEELVSGREAAMRCLRVLQDRKVNIRRCALLATECYYRGVEVHNAPGDCVCVQ